MNLFLMQPADQQKMLTELLNQAPDPESKMLVQMLMDALKDDPTGSKDYTQKLAGLLGLTASNPAAKTPPLLPQEQENPLDKERRQQVENLDKSVGRSEGEPMVESLGLGSQEQAVVS